ncbi:MAG TPA: polysaccharide pyruvyl transferase family protein [Ignavibacteriaceae bacterium]|nr:polysaccharide pyruvyl transferase family protein [Ignavibacteriaceae bacterium]
MKKIGILTYTKEYSNLGTNMQSYCTLKAIQRQFPNEQVELINYSRWKPIKKPYLSQISFKSLLFDYVRIKKYELFFKNNYVLSESKFVSPNLKDSINYLKQQKYDAIYVGSDTILELKRAGKNEITAYWLDATINCKKFMIAASSHKETFEELSSQQKEDIQNNINDFSLIGVRDEATFRLLSHFTKQDDKRLQLVPDPTFTFDIDYSYIEEYFKRKKIVLKKPIICLHLTRNTKWAFDLANHFRQEGYIVASLRPAYYADIIFTDLDPFEQVGLYKYFDLVITHRFHDSIFCLKNLTPVIVFPEYFTEITSYGENKNRTLFKAFNIEDNYIDKKDNLSAAYLFDMHKQAIANFEHKKDFIKEALLKNKNIYESFVIKSSEILSNHNTTTHLEQTLT